MHTRTHTPCFYLMPRMQKLTPYCRLLRSTIHVRGRADESPGTCYILYPVGQVLGRERQGGALCPLSCAPRGQQQLAHTNHSLTYTSSEGAFHTLTQSRVSPAMPEATPGLLTPHMEAECDMGCCLIMEGLRTEASKDPQTALPQWGLVT